MTLQIEETSLKEETDAKAVARRNEIVKELASLNEEQEAKLSKWQSEKKKLDGVKSYKEALEKAKLQLTTATNEADYATASKLQYDTIPSLEKKIEEASSRQGKDSMNCNRDTCICSTYVITRRSQTKGRIHVLLINETLGY